MLLKNNPIHPFRFDILTLGLDSGNGTFAAICLDKRFQAKKLALQIKLGKSLIKYKTYWHISHLFEPLVRNQVSIQER